MKKTLSLILALLMSASCAVSIFADEAEATSVITEDAPADTEVEAPVAEEATEYDLAVQFLVHKKIMQGKGETEDGELILGVKDDVKRYEMAVFAGRIATGWTKSTDWENGEDDRTEFTDLEGSGAKDSYGILSYVAEKNIIKGYPDGSFKPEATVTYRDALAIVVRTLGYNPDYPWGVIEKAVTLGLTEGITGVAYTDPINRGVAAQIMYNALFNATTAKGGNLAMDSFGVEYGWENILVVANDVASYEIGGKTTADTKGIVSFKLVEDNGELSDDVYYVHADITGDEVADLTFGKFYNALFEIDEDEELVDMIGAIEYEAKVLKNAGNDADAEIAAFMADYTIVDKYNVKNLSKDTLYNDEIIVVEDGSETIVIDYDYAKDSKYAINWETGDILEKNADGTYKTLWYYNEQYDVYFQFKKDATIDTELGEIAGISVMSEKELETLKASIKAAYEVTDTFDGYELYKGAFDSAYAKLVAYDLDGDDMYDYAKYNTYKFGTYEGIKGDGDAGKCGSCDALKSHKFDGKYYPIAGTCDHFKAGHDDTYTLIEVTPGYTGYVIYDVDETANTIEIIKEIPALGKNADEDSYVATGIVRGLDASGKYVLIGNEKLGFDYDNLIGTNFPKAGDNAKKYVSEFFDSLFNQFVEYVLVDGKIVKINTKGGSTSNYIVVEDYYGIDSDGYIVVAGYTTSDLKYDTFRIGAFDGWKTGSGFFYNEEQMEEYFEKGNVYQITSADDTEKNGVVYYVTCIGNNTGDNEIEALQAFKAEGASVKVVDNYRVTTLADGTKKTKRLDDGQTYVVIGDVKTQALGEFMPIYYYKGKLPADWTITGDFLVMDDGLYIICNVTAVSGFNFDTYKTGYVVLRENFMKTAKFDGYGSDYYVYGAAKYDVEAFDLLTGKTDDYAASTNFKLDEYEIYNTIDKTIVSDDAKNWTEFWANAKGAYADSWTADRVKDGDPDYIFATVAVSSNDTIKDKEAVSKNIVSDMLALTGDYTDLITGDYRIYELELDAKKNITKFDEFKWADDVTKDNVNVYVIYNAKTAGCVVYVDVNNGWDNEPAPVAPTTDAFDNTIKAESADKDEATIKGSASLDAKYDENGKLVASITDITLTWADKATADTHAAIEADGFCFGEAGECTVEKWQTLVNDVRVYGTLKADTYKPHDDEEVVGVCDLINSITIKPEKAIKINDKKDGATAIEIEFTDSTTRTWTITVGAWINDGKVETWFARDNALAPVITNSALNLTVVK